MKPTDIRVPDYFHKVVDCQWACPAHTPVPEYIRLIAAGRYSDAYMERLLRKFDSAKELVPQPLLTVTGENARYGVIYYGSTSPAMSEAIELLKQQNQIFDTLRIRAYPFPDFVADFIKSHGRAGDGRASSACRRSDVRCCRGLPGAVAARVRSLPPD